MVRKSNKIVRNKRSSTIKETTGNKSLPKKICEANSDFQSVQETSDKSVMGNRKLLKSDKMVVSNGRKRSQSDSSDDSSVLAKQIKIEPDQSAETTNSSVQVLGTDLVYRQHNNIVSFSTSSVIELLGQVLPLAKESLSNVVEKDQDSSVSKTAFVAWSTVKLVLFGGLLDLALRDLLVESKEETSDSESTSKVDILIIQDVEVKFKVRGGKVYLDVSTAFKAIDTDHEVLKGIWQKVDQQLAKQGISQKDAFKKRGNCDGRSYVTLKAFQVICEGDEAKQKVDTLVSKVDDLVLKVENIEHELQQTVDMILRTYCIIPRNEVVVVTSSGEPSPRLSQKCCDNLLCGRGYHFVLQCCNQYHVLSLGGYNISFVRHNGRIFLEKCSAFGALGRMYVIRCSDYRKTDRILMEVGGENCKIGQHFLFEQNDTSLVRNRRTHMSLDAFILLVKANFADQSKTYTLLQSISQLEKGGFGNLSKCNEQFDEVIDLSESDIEEVKMEITDSEADVIDLEDNSSGFESEDLGSMVIDKNDEHVNTDSTSDMGYDDDLAFPILGQDIPIKLLDGRAFLDKASIFKLMNFPHMIKKGSRVLNKMLEDGGICIDDAIRYVGRQKGFISTSALKVIIESSSLDSFDQKDLLLEELSKLEENKNLALDRKIQLQKLSETMKYKVLGDTVFLDSMKLLKLAGFFMMNQPPSKVNIAVCKALAERGMDTDQCFLKQGKSKYAMISAIAALTLLRSEIGPLADVGRASQLSEDILEGLSSQGLIDRMTTDLPEENKINIGGSFPSIRFKLHSGILFLQRKTCFEALGLESAILSCKKGYSAINSMLTSGGLNLSDCYIATKHQRYSYISCIALIHLLECRDPLIVCLSNKEQFLTALLSVLQIGAISQLHTADSHPTLKWTVGDSQKRELEVKSGNGQLFFSRRSAFELSGLEDETNETFDSPDGLLTERGLLVENCYMSDGTDIHAWVSLHALFVMMSVSGGCGEGGGDSYHSVAWRDLLSAIALQEPRLRTHIKMDRFKTDLLAHIMELYVRSLSVNENIKDLTDSESGVETENMENNKDLINRNNRNLSDDNENYDHVVPRSTPVSPIPSISKGLQEESLWSDASSATFPTLTLERYSQLKREILEAAGGVGGTIGDWELIRADSQVKLCVRSGYGASRKVSFVQPDYAAILRYSVTFDVGHCEMLINNLAIPNTVLETLLDRGEKEGTLSLLYQLISIRPCFGAFSPELVETVKQWGADTMESEQLTVDTTFIGTSSSGRTYAGTVRTTDCSLLAEDRVSDRCSKCSRLDSLTINRSILANQKPDKKKTANQQPGGKALQQSVWQLATTSEAGCSFVCPQVQSFNTSLPHAFDGSAQANTVVKHRVEITNDMKVVVNLSDRLVSSTFDEFTRDRQLGPLLDWVAGLRLCVGYPASQLVQQAAFIISNSSRLRPDLKKLFKFLVVDRDFSYKVDNQGEEENVGTIRAATCQVTTETGADICQQCRLLQEPIEFLAV